MKSPQVMFFESPEEAAKYSDLQILASNAGYYVGTVYIGDEGWQEPGSRDSEYFKTSAEAEQALKELEAGTRKGRMIP